MGRLRIGIGASEASDPQVAGTSAARAAIAELAGAPAALVIVYASVSYPLPDLLAAIRAVTGDTPLVGASSNGQFHAGNMIAPGIGVSVLVLSAGPYRFGTALVGDLSANSFAAGQELTRRAHEAVESAPADPEDPAGPASRQGYVPVYSALLLFADGLTGADLPELLSGIYRVAGARVPVVGGVASDDRRVAETFVFHGAEAHRDAAVAVWVDSPHPLQVVSAHGWQAEGLPMLVTQSDGVIVQEIGGRPALEVFREHFRIEADFAENVAHREEYDSTHAFSLVEPDGSQAIRGAFIGDDGELRTFAPLPQYAAVRIVSCSPETLLEVSEEVVSEALALRESTILLTFSCTGRMDILASRCPEEPKRLQAAAGATPTFGFYTYGEFARTTSVAGYHNATITALAL